MALLITTAVESTDFKQLATTSGCTPWDEVPLLEPRRTVSDPSGTKFDSQEKVKNLNSPGKETNLHFTHEVNERQRLVMCTVVCRPDVLIAGCADRYSQWSGWGNGRSGCTFRLLGEIHSESKSDTENPWVDSKNSKLSSTTTNTC